MKWAATHYNCRSIDTVSVRRLTASFRNSIAVVVGVVVVVWRELVSCFWVVVHVLGAVKICF